MATQKSVPYKEFGDLLALRRSAAGFSKQQELATALDVAQQSVSRWEKGLGRPRINDVRALEKLVGAREGELLAAAGYGDGDVGWPAEDVPTATSYDKPLPLAALAPDTFESFSATLLSRLYRSQGGEAHRYGGPGHKQHGIDVEVTGPFGTHTFQCKRVNEFGAQKVHTAVAEQTIPADLKVLLLSIIASTKARDAMASHAGWQLWDRDDITRKFHELSMADRLDLVDRYFNGQRLDLLGVDEPGPLQAPEAFFKPFLVPDRLFNHAWELVGREAEVVELVTNVSDDSVVLTCLVGTPGAGKSRLLREVSLRLETQTPALRVWFLSPTEEVKAHHLDGLRDSQSGKTLLVVDDAHEREDLGILLRHAAVPENNTRLLLSLRPYGKEALKLQAADVSLVGPLVRFVELHQQTREEAEALAASVLKGVGGPVAASADVAGATYTTPLVTVLASQLLSRSEIPLALLSNTEDLRTHVLGRLQDVIALRLVTGQDGPKLRSVLRVISLVQPIIPDDPSLLALLENVEKVDKSDATRLMRLIGEAGVLFKRGVRSRIAPDLLADEILRANYINLNGAANELASAAFDQAGAEHLKNMFVNLGRLDWRLREGKTDESALLNSLAPKLKWGDKYSHPHIDAVEAVAYYQPRFALNFAKQLIAEGHGNNGSVCSMVRNAAYTYDHALEACDLLWKAGRQDSRALNQHPSHAIRILKELASFQLNKPIAYVSDVVEFALALLERPASLTSAYTPFTILEGALGTEMESTSYSRNTLTITRYQLPFDEAKGVRQRISSELLRYIGEEPPRRAFLAADTLSNALRGPMHADTSDHVWENEHLSILRQLQTVLREKNVPPVVLVRVAESVAWHAFYGFESTAVEAQAILAFLKRDLKTRLARSLIDGWGTQTWRLSDSLHREEHVADRDLLAKDLEVAFPEPSALFDSLEGSLNDIAAIASEGYGSSFMLVNYLLESIPGLAGELLVRDERGEAGRLQPFVGKALSAIIESSDSSLLAGYVARSQGSTEALAQVAEAYMRYEPSRAYSEGEVELFKRIFSSVDVRVLFVASGLARQIGSRNPALALDLACRMDFAVNQGATHDVFMWLAGDKEIPPTELAMRRGELLEKLVALEELEDYWVNAFLVSATKADPVAVVDLVKARLIECDRRHSWTYKPLDVRHGGSPLGLLGVEAGPRLLRELFEWMLEKLKADADADTDRFAKAVAGLCGPFDTLLLEFLTSWMADGASAAHAGIVAAVLREGSSELVYERTSFVKSILDAAEMISDRAVADIRSSLSAAAHLGMRGGTPGEPFPEDLKLEKHCLNMLATLSRAEPAYELYDELLRWAQHGIARQRRAKEALEDED